MLTQDDMMPLARLARLSPDPDRLGRYGAQCADILNYMELLGEVDTREVEPLYSPIEHEAAYRADLPERRRTRDEILANAPETDGQFFVVPRIV